MTFIEKIIIAIVVSLVVVPAIIMPVLVYNSKETITITVKNKERITTGGGQNIQSKYLVYTEGEVFENTDAPIFWKFNSADFQNNLEVGRTYTVTVAGWRVPFMSWFRNIVEM